MVQTYQGFTLGNYPFGEFSHLGGQANVYFEAFEHRANAADHFAGPKLLTEQNERTILEIADGAEKIFRKVLVITVNAATRQFAFHFRITCSDEVAGTGAECFILEAIEQRLL